jgi:hypothetical protein
MINDLLVSGTSIASGWHSGKVSADPREYSWINYFANSANIQNVWNHSYVSKPMQATMEHTILFCEQYLERYGNYKNLFVIAEFTLPQNVKWPTLGLKNGINSEIITPVVIQHAGGINNADLASTYKSIFVRHKTNLNLLDHNTSFNFVGVNEIDDADLTAHGLRLQRFVETSESNLTFRLESAKIEITQFQDWLFERNIPHLFFWGGGIGESFHNMVDKALLPIVKQNRLIPMKEFTCFSKSAEWSIKHDNYHPDQQGHKKIAEFIYNYVVKHDLLAPPVTKYTQGHNYG